jgi:hypothetical protein
MARANLRRYGPEPSIDTVGFHCFSLRGRSKANIAEQDSSNDEKHGGIVT